MRSHKNVVGIYVRVSTSEQHVDAQEAQLKQYAEHRQWSIYRTYRDRISGATTNRPGLQQLLSDARKHKFGIILVWRFDRFARSLRDLVNALELCKSLRIDFCSATEGIDTTVPSGELLFGIIGSIAQFERSLISERVRMGIAHAREKGSAIGRPPARILGEGERIHVAQERAKHGLSLRALAKKYDVSVWQILQAIKENGQCLE